MCWRDLVTMVSAYNHAEEMVAFSPLTVSVCINYHDTFRFECYGIYVSQNIHEVISCNVLGRFAVHKQKGWGMGWYTWLCLDLGEKIPQ